MSQTPVISSNTVADLFELDVRIITDPTQGTAVPCDTNDGCDPTCASACLSGS